MDARLNALEAEYADLLRGLQNPIVLGNPAELARIGRRLKELEPIAERIAHMRACERTIAAATDMAADPELGQIATEEAEDARAILVTLDAEIQEMLRPRDPRDCRNVILEVRAGTGGEEAALFAGELLRMYLRFCERRRWKAELLDSTAADAGGVKEAIVRIVGDGAFGMLKNEGGVHRVQRIPSTEAKGRIHTSAATVAVLPEAEEVDVSIRSEDLRIDTFRSSGAGGQHVNKTESAVRITHIPTNIVVSCQSERSQLQNRARAMQLLRSKLLQNTRETEERAAENLRRSQVRSGDRSDKIRTYNFPQDRVTDHRIDRSFHNLPAILDGNLDALLAAVRDMQGTAPDDH